MNGRKGRETNEKEDEWQEGRVNVRRGREMNGKAGEEQEVKEDEREGRQMAGWERKWTGRKINVRKGRECNRVYCIHVPGHDPITFSFPVLFLFDWVGFLWPNYLRC